MLSRRDAYNRVSNIGGAIAKRAALHATRYLLGTGLNMMKRKAFPDSTYRTVKKIKTMKKGAVSYSYADKKIKPRRKAKALRRGGRYKSMSQGVNFVYEYGTVKTTTDQTIYIGHATCPQAPALRAVWSPVVKELFKKMGMNVVGTGSSTDIRAGDQITVYYQVGPASGWTSESLTCAASDTLDIVVDWCVSVARGWYRVQEAKFDLMLFVPQTTSSPCLSTVRLDCAMVSIKYSSRLKVQNRSVTSVSNVESTDVDNAPLYGKIYEGFGHGPDVVGIFNAAFDLSADDTNGVIYNTGGTSGTGPWAEPLDLNSLRGVKKFGKVMIQPGKIQTHVVSFTVRGMFNKVLNGSYYTDKSGFLQDKYGLIAIERMIQSAAGESVVIAVEKELKITSNCYCKTMNTQTKFTKTIV